MNKLEEYYNKFNEEKRLNSRHGQVEFAVTMHYLHLYLQELEKSGIPKNRIQILDVGAGTGRYAIPLSEEGYSVTAVEPVRHNLGRLKQNGPLVQAYQGRAEKLKRCADQTYDVVLFFGPMYHIKEQELRLAAMQEAYRVLKPSGHLFVSYIMNEYSVLMYGFKEHHIREAMASGMIDPQFHCTDLANPLYEYVRLEDIRALSNQAGFEREKLIAADGPANHMRRILNEMDEEEFALFIQYQLTVCERPELLGATCHALDILKKGM